MADEVTDVDDGRELDPMHVHELPEDAVAVHVVRLGHANGRVTTVEFPYPPDHPHSTSAVDAIRNANVDQLSDHGRATHQWFHSLPDAHQPYFVHLLDLDTPMGTGLWGQASPDGGLPVWVSAHGHPDLAQAIADHFSIRGNRVKVIGHDEAHARFAASIASPDGRTV